MPTHDDHDPAPGPGAIRALFARHGLALTAAQADMFWRFHQFFRRENERLNLSRLHAFTTIVVKHYIDSVLAGTLIALPSPLLDLGSGPGFPGIPLKIMHPELTLLLSDARAHRARFLQQAVDLLGLSDVRIIPHGITPAFTEQVGAVITRAVGSIPSILKATRNCLRPGGLAIFMKGPSLTEAHAAAEACEGFAPAGVTPYRIPHTPHRRTLAVFRRQEDARAATVVESPDNPTLKLMRRLLTSSGIRKEGLALFAGRKIVPELLRTHPERIRACAVRIPGAPPEGLPPRVPVIALKSALFDPIDPAGTRGPILVAEAPPLPPWRPEAGPGVSLLIGLQDPANVGAVLRLAAAFAVKEAVILAEGANPYLPRSLRASGPAVLDVPLYAGPPLAELAAGDLPLVALSARGTPIDAFDFPPGFALLTGIEGPGLPRDLPVSASVAIPMAGRVESLNAATAIAIALYACRRQAPPLRPLRDAP